MSFKEDFKAFIMKGNVLELAIAVVIGGAFGKIVTTVVAGLVMPLVGYVLPGGAWQTWNVGPFQVGMVLGAVIDFLIISLVIFLVLVKGVGAISKKPAETPPPPALKECPFCLEQIPAAATRCKFCTSQIN